MNLCPKQFASASHHSSQHFDAMIWMRNFHSCTLYALTISLYRSCEKQKILHRSQLLIIERPHKSWVQLSLAWSWDHISHIHSFFPIYQTWHNVICSKLGNYFNKTCISKKKDKTKSNWFVPRFSQPSSITLSENLLQMKQHCFRLIGRIWGFDPSSRGRENSAQCRLDLLCCAETSPQQLAWILIELRLSLSVLQPSSAPTWASLSS